ncbi:MAG TPA: AmmeMemoRadiSam system protein B [Methylomirabilota bacterium]|nr:AmmeMemoRadiSam system protein B [Methylomirabilota bacterium]
MTFAGNPRLRALEAFPVEHEGQRCIALRDPAGFTDQIAVLPPAVLDLVSLFDGDHSVEEIRAILAERHGEAPSAEQIALIIERFDAALFLDSDRFQARRGELEEAFRRSPLRQAGHAGGAYAGEPAALARQIDGFFVAADGPGREGQTGGTREGIRGLLAPHIDFHRGGSTYAWAYKEVLERSDADLYVILGTCHAGMPDPFSVTLKPYDTPLGAVPVDRDFYDTLSRRAGQDLLASEPAHRAEHSIEFQAVMLQHLVSPRRPFTILPVLASYLHEAVWTRGNPDGDARVPRFVDALRETIAATSRRVCLIGGVDLAHVGPRFGDPQPNTAASLAAVERADRSMLDSVLAGDARGFFASVAADRDARRICGLSPIYTLLRLLPEAPGRLLRYTQWPDPEGAVTFCAVSFP